MVKKMLYLKADTNDADYVTTFEEVDEEEINDLRPIIEVIKKHRSYPDTFPHLRDCCTWNTREMDDETVEDEYKGELTEAQIELMNEYIPYGEFGVHTIDTIKIYTISDEDNLLRDEN